MTDGDASESDLAVTITSETPIQGYVRNSSVKKHPNMDPQTMLLCDDCSSRWNRLDFWHSCPSDAEAPQEKWGHVHLRKFGEIKESRQCRLCQLICHGLTNNGRSHFIRADQVIYFSKWLFREYDSKLSLNDQTGNHSKGLKEQVEHHFINHLCISTFPSFNPVEREYVGLAQSGTHLCTYFECRITLLRKHNDNHHSFHGRRINATFDRSLASQWIRMCSTTHVAGCSLSSTTKQPRRVINVVEGRVQLTPPLCSYVALSYRWPTSPGLRLTSATEARLIEKGGLNHYSTDILPIVKDSMKFLKDLGKTYLWVDALCIPQEEKTPDLREDLCAERADQVGSMADIYHSAHFTIVASSDPNSDRGLPGVRSGTRFSQARVDTNDLDFAIVKPSLTEAIESSQWISRVWTFQEAAQSRRLLIFTDHQAFFHCHGAMWSEDTLIGEPGQQNIREIHVSDTMTPYWRNSAPEKRLQFRDWVQAIEQYTQRKASWPEDFPKGLDFVKERNSSHCCLPKENFARALCFETWGGSRRTSNSPTWCWCGWRVTRGVKYASESKDVHDLDEEFDSCPFIPQLAYDSTGNTLLQLPIGDDQPRPAFLDIMERISTSSITELSNRIEFRTLVFGGILSFGGDGLEGDCTISLAFKDFLSTVKELRINAILALDCGKNDGDSVVCVTVGKYRATEEEVWLLVVETDEYDISRRIGTATTCSVELLRTNQPLDTVTLT